MYLMLLKDLAGRLEGKGHDIMTISGMSKSQRDAGVEDPRTSRSAASGFSSTREVKLFARLKMVLAEKPK